MPVFLVRKDAGIISTDNFETAEKHSNFLWSIKEEDILTQNRGYYPLLFRQFEILERDGLKEDF